MDYHLDALLNLPNLTVESCTQQEQQVFLKLRFSMKQVIILIVKIPVINWVVLQKFSQTLYTELYYTHFNPRCSASQIFCNTTGYEAGKLLRSLRDKADQWWYFLDHPEVPPDNNLAERSLRLAVTKRKGARGFTVDKAVCSDGGLTQCSANLSPTGTVSHRVFQTSLDSEVRELDIPAISVASTDHLNPYAATSPAPCSALIASLH